MSYFSNRSNRRRNRQLERSYNKRSKRAAALQLANNHKRKNGQRKAFKKTVLKILVAVLVIFVVGIGSLFAYYTKDLPSSAQIENLAIAESTKIYARDGKTILFEVFDEERRTSLKFDEIPDSIKKATIAIEDDDFYFHHGVDFKGIIRAVISNLTGGSIQQGGSTITQQLVKNVLLTTEKTFDRKIKELILAIQIESRFSKDEILNMYLNAIPYGSNAYGIEAASQTYFSKDAKKLSLAESALLAALPQRPSMLSPYGPNKDQLLERKDYVLERMNKLGMISEEEMKKAQEEKFKFVEQTYDIKAPHFVFWVIEQLTEEYGEDIVERGGLKVTTTLDINMQKAAEKAVKEGAERNLAQYGVTNAALTAMNPSNGQVMAHVGSKDYFNKDIDGSVDVARSDQQPGSSFKPYEYTAAFEKGYPPSTILFDVRTDFDGYKPENYDKGQRGPVTMRSALQMSLNIPAVKTTYLVGKDNVIDFAHRMGISTLQNKEDYGLAVGLGAGEVKLVDHVAGFGVFANEGKKMPRTTVLKIEDPSGKTIYDWEKDKDKGEQVLDRNVALTINNVLSDDSARAPMFGSGTILTLPDRRVAVKTGTTENHTDGLTVGYTPQLSAGVWVGNNDNTPFSGGDGFYVAAPIWNQFMQEALSGKEAKWYDDPAPISASKPVLAGKAGGKGERVKISRIDGKLAPKDLPSNYVEEKEFVQYHNILYYCQKDDPQGPYPSSPQSDPMFNNWENAVKGWSKGKEDGTPPTQTSPYGAAEVKPTISILQPGKNAVISDSSFTIIASAKAIAGVKSVDFSIDGSVVGSRAGEPYAIKVSPNLSNGYHKIGASVTDIYGGTAQTSVDIQIQIDDSAPSASFTSSLASNTVTLDASASTDNIGVVSYSWDFGDNSTGSGKNITHTFDEPGNYTIVLTVSDEAGNTDTNTKKITIP